MARSDPSVSSLAGVGISASRVMSILSASTCAIKVESDICCSPVLEFYLNVAARNADAVSHRSHFGESPQNFGKTGPTEGMWKTEEWARLLCYPTRSDASPA